MDLPKNFLDSMKKLLDTEYEAYLESFQKESVQGIRINTSKISTEEFLKLTDFELEPVPWVSNGFYVKSKMAVTKHPHYYAGLYYVQEPSAMLPASRLPIEQGDKVLDLCAAPGGKATELGSRLKGSGLLVANDISNSRAKGLLKNLEVFGLGNILALSETPQRLLKSYGEYFDKILIDAPCSGEGMFRKDPSMVKSYLEHGTEYYVPIQHDIISTGVQLLKPGGKLLYSTCTFSPEENEKIVNALLKKQPQMQLLSMEGCEGFARGFPAYANDDPEITKCIRLFPHRIRGEGHFAALFEKKASPADAEKGHRKDNAKGCAAFRRSPVGERKKALPEWEEFASTYLTRDFGQYDIVQIEDRLYALPSGTEIKKGIRYLRTGLYLGDVKKKRFEPSQALSMNLRREECKSCVSFSREDQRISRYLRGETLELTCEEAASLKAWCLVCVDGYPLGWGKWVNQSLRNKYYAGWRM